MIGKRFGLEIIRSLAKIAGVSLVIFCISLVVGFALGQTILPDSLALAANQIFAPPTYNWYVCEDLGIGPVPGVPDNRQILRLCHNQGWEIRAFCLQPSLPAPPIGATCSHTPADTYWCGDTYQLLREFALDVTPTATLVPSVTNTAIPTRTTQPSATFTLTPSQTASSTPTTTEIPTDTPPPTLTPRLTRTFTLTPSSPTDTPIPSVTGTQLATLTPAATLTDIPGASRTPTTAPSQTPQVSSTSTSVVLTETPSPTSATTQSPTPTEARETSVPTATLSVHTPNPTPRTRPGGSGNLGRVSMLLVSLGALSFAIGFLGLLVLQKSTVEVRSPATLRRAHTGSQRTLKLNRGLLLVILAMLIVLGGYLLTVWVPQWIIGQPPTVTIPAVSLSGIPSPLTATPFQPRHPTPVYAPHQEPDTAPPFEFQQIRLAPQSDWVQMMIDPASPQVNQGKPIQLSFIPGASCNFGDQQACVSAHTLEQQKLVFLTIHSGLGGEAQAFRHAVEGTGINRAAFSLPQIQTNLNALQGAQVSLTTQGDEAGGLALRGVMRIPATQVEAYFALPIAEALELAAAANPEVWARIDPDQPMLIFETCGWKLPSEPGAAGVADTTGSVYIGVIQPVR